MVKNVPESRKNVYHLVEFQCYCEEKINTKDLEFMGSTYT